MIEAHADDFDRPSSSELTAEQRLLLTRQLQGAGDNVADAARRLANSGTPDASSDEQGIAATILNQNAGPATEVKPAAKIDPSTQAIINSIVIQGPPH